MVSLIPQEISSTYFLAITVTSYLRTIAIIYFFYENPDISNQISRHHCVFLWDEYHSWTEPY